MVPLLIGYGTFLASLFTVFTVMFSFSTTVWGFALIFSGCTAVSLILWWREESQWQESFHEHEPVSFPVTLPSSSIMTGAPTPSENPRQIQDWLPLEDEDLNFLETGTKDLTERIEAVYPLVDREHVHQIVWAVMIELFSKRMATSSYSTPASVTTARKERAA